MRKHLNLIQFSRAIVPLLVLLFHAKAFLNHYFNYEFTSLSNVARSGGVYYFFALSGFMVFYLYYKNFGNPKMINDFLYNRFIRIYPAYWLLTIFVLPVYFLYPGFGDGSETKIISIITSFLLIPYVDEPIISVAWSLVHTVYFYLIFSLLFINKQKLAKSFIILWLILTIVYNAFSFSTFNYLISFLLNINNIIFILGMSCAYFVLKIKIPIKLSMTLILIGFLGFPLAWINEHKQWIDVSLQLLTTIASIMLILGLSSIDLQKNIRLPKTLKFLGDASFSIYLTHFTTMSIISNILVRISFVQLSILSIALLLIIVPIIVGCIFYTFIEKPIHTKFKNMRRKKQGNISKEKFKHIESKAF